MEACTRFVLTSSVYVGEPTSITGAGNQPPTHLQLMNFTGLASPCLNKCFTLVFK